MAMVEKKTKPITKTLIIIVILTFIIITFIPYFWMLLSSFKTRVDLLSTTPKWIFKPTLESFPNAFIDREFLKYFINSLIVAVVAVVVSIIVGIPCAYAISRFDFQAKGHFFFFILTTRMAPPVAFALPLYILFSKFGILGTHLGVIIAHITFTLSFIIWIMKGFFDDIPIEIEQAAMTDGYTIFGAFKNVILPIVKPGIVATALFSFIFSWNEFLFALVLGGTASRTLPAAFPGLVTPHGTFWGQLSAVGTVVTIPVIILAFILQKHLVRGLSFGAVKQ
jgi:multiple sugar transport system permease protein